MRSLWGILGALGALLRLCERYLPHAPGAALAGRQAWWKAMSFAKMMARFCVTYPCLKPIASMHFGQRWEEVGASGVSMPLGSSQDPLLTE